MDDLAAQAAKKAAKRFIHFLAICDVLADHRAYFDTGASA
jgi:hypothetical protein